MSEDQRRRQQPSSQQALRAVEVGGSAFSSRARCARPRGELLPFRRRARAAAARRAPTAAWPVGVGVDVVGDAVLVDLPGDALLRLGEIVGVEIAGVRRRISPVGSQRAGAGEQFVEVAVGRGIRGRSASRRSSAGTADRAGRPMDSGRDDMVRCADPACTGTRGFLEGRRHGAGRGYGRARRSALAAGSPPRSRSPGTLVATSARVHHVVAKPTERSVHPGVDDIEGQRRVDSDGGVKSGWRLPGAIATPPRTPSW